MVNNEISMKSLDEYVWNIELGLVMIDEMAKKSRSFRKKKEVLALGFLLETPYVLVDPMSSNGFYVYSADECLDYTAKADEGLHLSIDLAKAKKTSDTIGDILSKYCSNNSDARVIRENTHYMRERLPIFGGYDFESSGQTAVKVMYRRANSSLLEYSMQFKKKSESRQVFAQSTTDFFAFFINAIPNSIKYFKSVHESNKRNREYNAVLKTNDYWKIKRFKADRYLLDCAIKN